ncbi:MAG: LVIVD repeat-containing protein [Actinomycetota bacterium]
MTHTEAAQGLRVVGHSDLGGCGDGMQVMRHGDALYVGHLGTSGMGTSILDVSDPSRPRLVDQWRAPPGTHTHKVQVADGLLLVNHERFRGGEGFSAGMAVYDVEDPFAPRRVGFFSSGGLGVHRIVWTGGRFAYMSAIPDGFDDRIWVIVDLSDPAHPHEVGRWWWSGMWRGGGERPGWSAPTRYAAHHALLQGSTAYLAFGDAGMVVLDVADVRAPEVRSTLQWSPGGDTHTCMPLPGRNLVVSTDEAVKDRCAEERKLVRVIDVSDRADPRVLGICPPPGDDFCARGLRYGPHNLHENRPGTYRSEQIVFVTYFNAGLRVYDVSEAGAPSEIAHWLPAAPPGQEAPQTNDLLVDADGRIFVTDRVNGGLYVLATEDGLAERMERVRI